MSVSSAVGLRAAWTCAVCGARAVTHQIQFLAGTDLLELPPGWEYRKGWSVCEKHAQTPDQGKPAELRTSLRDRWARRLG